MGKRLLAIFISVGLCISGTPAAAQESGVIQTASGAPEEIYDGEALEAAAAADGTLPARSAILIEQETGRVLFEKEADIQLPPASITKVMTLLLVMEAIDAGRLHLEDEVTCSDHAASMGGSQIWLEPGEQMCVADLLKATAIASANDASVALAEHLAGSEEAFVQLMNDRAAQLGMTSTHFVNATGLDAEGHLSSARDIALMSRELLFHPLISEYSSVWMSSLRDGKTQLVNTNKVVCAKSYTRNCGLLHISSPESKPYFPYARPMCN